MTHRFLLSHFNSPWRSYFIKKLSIELAANMQLVVCNKCKKSSLKSRGYMVISTTFIESIAAIQSIHLIQIWGIRGFCLSTCVRFFVRCIVFLCAASTFCVRHRCKSVCVLPTSIGVCVFLGFRGYDTRLIEWVRFFLDMPICRWYNA